MEHARVGGRAGVVLHGESRTVIKKGGWKSGGKELAAGEDFGLDPLETEAAPVQFPGGFPPSEVGGASGLRFLTEHVHFAPVAEEWAGHRLATSPQPLTSTPITGVHGAPSGCGVALGVALQLEPPQGGSAAGGSQWEPGEDSCMPCGCGVGAPSCGAAVAREAPLTERDRVAAAAAGVGPRGGLQGASRPVVDFRAPSHAGDVAGVAYRLERCRTTPTVVVREFQDRLTGVCEIGGEPQVPPRNKTVAGGTIEADHHSEIRPRLVDADPIRIRTQAHDTNPHGSAHGLEADPHTEI